MMTRRGPCVFKGSFFNYKNMMSSIVTVGGDALLVSGVRERSLEQSRCAERFGHRPSEFYPFVVPPSKQMTPGTYQRMKEHDAIGQERYSTPFIADIEQNPWLFAPATVHPDSRDARKAGRFQNSSGRGRLAHHHHDRGGASDLPGGEPAHWGLRCADCPWTVCLFQELLDGLCLSPSELNHLTGNAMHLSALGTWLFYCLSCMDVLTPADRDLCSIEIDGCSTQTQTRTRL